MASCSTNASDSDDSHFKCSLCLETCKRPKLLPCSHTFCEDCLKDLVKHNTYHNSFRCPYCREVVQIPKGGVSAFKNNFYLESRLAKAPGKPRDLFCKIHSSKPRELELFCVPCNRYICLKCKLDDHRDHTTVDLEERAKSVKAELTKDKQILNNDSIAGVKKRLNELKSEQQTVFDKGSKLRKEILKRHKMMVDVADQCRDEALFSLDSVTACIDSQLDNIGKKMQKSLDSLEKLDKRMEKCLTGEDGIGMLLTAQEIYNDAAKIEKNVQEAMAPQITAVSRPVLRASTSADFTLEVQRKFLGHVERMDMDVTVQVAVKEVFRRIPADDCCEIFSLFPKADNTAWIAYEPSCQSTQPAKFPELLDCKGRVIEEKSSVRGRTNFTQSRDGRAVCVVQGPGSFSTYAKSRRQLLLRNSLSGTACVMIVSQDLGQSHFKPQFTFKCGPHRAVDMEPSKGLVAVVEEAWPPETHRKVHLYQQPHEVPVATYTPPVGEYQPSDVCFIHLAGQEVLLVADEMNDAIHIVGLKSTPLKLLGYLAPGSPLIRNPTALNTDEKMQLWVACRGGSIILFH